MIKGYFILAVFCLLQIGNLGAQQLNVASYNLRYDNAVDSAAGNGWQVRYPVIAEIVKFNALDVFGVQEGFFHMLNNLTHRLPGYSWVGVGRDGGRKKEFSAIFYRLDGFELLASGNFWLSPTNTSSPNVGWDAALTRVCTWARFKDLKTGFVFNFFNVHMDHVGVTARTESAKLILAKIKRLGEGYPCILTGDFNADQSSDAYKTFVNSSLLKDCFTEAPIKLGAAPTFNGFKVQGLQGNARIDHIFVTGKFKVNRYGILTQSTNGRLPSDHFPVVVNLQE